MIIKQNPKHPKHPCIDCGKPCHLVSQRCKSCNAKYKWKQGILSLYHFPKGEGNKNWRGGKSHTPAGYILILKPEHPRARKNGYIFEHILIWEEANNKPLPEGWIIHHLNGVKSDNRIRNLTALPSQKHFLVLAAKAKRIQELEGLLNGKAQLL